MNVSPKQLRLFLTLCETLNFSKAAERSFMTQPALSKSIQDLEAELGLVLFERTTRSVRLSPAGTRLASLARSIVGEFDAGLQRLRSSAEWESLQLSVAAWPSLSNVVMPEVCAQLERRFKNPKITVFDCTNSACIQRVLDYQADFALGTVDAHHPDLQYAELMRDRFVVLASGKWRRMVPAHLHLEELQQLPVITLTDASTAMRYISASFLRRGIEYRPKMQVDQVSTVAGLVKKEVGVAVLPYLGVMPILGVSGIQLSQIVDGPLRSVGFVRRQLGTSSSLAEAAMESVRDTCESLMQKHPEWVMEPARPRPKLTRLQTPAAGRTRRPQP
jgi:LysR family transcriptional regulator, carnitine catabolism transcriptional activator